MTDPHVLVEPGIDRGCRLCGIEYRPLRAVNIVCPECTAQLRHAGLRFADRVRLVLVGRRIS